MVPLEVIGDPDTVIAEFEDATPTDVTVPVPDGGVAQFPSALKKLDVPPPDPATTPGVDGVKIFGVIVIVPLEVIGLEPMDSAPAYVPLELTPTEVTVPELPAVVQTNALPFQARYVPPAVGAGKNPVALGAV